MQNVEVTSDLMFCCIAKPAHCFYSLVSLDTKHVVAGSGAVLPSEPTCRVAWALHMFPSFRFLVCKP